jgi:hypothetical protein
MKNINNSGNVLFIILLGIALFAGLSAAVTQSGKSTGRMSSEKDSIKASEIIDYATSIQGAVRQIMISNSCADTEISFETPQLTSYEHSPVTRDQCKIYHSAGGKVSYRAPDISALDRAQSAQSGFGEWFLNGGLGVAHVGSSGLTKDLLLVLPYVSRDVCAKINDKVGVENQANGTPPVKDNTPAGNFILKYTGSYGGGVDIDGNGASPSNQFTGKMLGCTTSSSNTGAGRPLHAFFAVLHAR